jgi:hypothetical protein
MIVRNAPLLVAIVTISCVLFDFQPGTAAYHAGQPTRPR